MTFTEHLTALEDPRHPVNIRHDFFDLLFLTVSAILSQAEGWEDIEEYGKMLRRSFDSAQDKLSALHSISAYATEQGVILTQESSESKKNERRHYNGGCNELFAKSR